MKTKRKRLQKRMNTNYISTNWNVSKEDKVIFGADQKRRYIGGYVTEDDAYLVISAANSTYGNELYQRSKDSKQSYRYNR
jgi:hypothetical protein